MRSRRPAVCVQRRPPPGRRIDPKTAARVRLTESQTRRKTSAISSLACPGTGQRRHERGNLRLCRHGLQSETAAQDVHLHLHCLGAAVIRRPAGGGLAYPEFELALGVLRGGSAGDLRRRNGATEPAPYDALTPAKRSRCAETRAIVGCRTPCRGRRRAATRGSAIGLGHGGARNWRSGRPSRGAATAHATQILEIPSWPLAGYSNAGVARWRLLRW